MAECDKGPLICGAQDVGKNVADAAQGVKDLFNKGTEAVGNAVSAASDPFGYVFQKMQEGAASLSHSILDAATKATIPDLSAQWFLDVYKASFGIAVTFSVLLLMIQIWKTATGRQGASDLFDAVGKYFPGFLIGSAFGPSIGALLALLIQYLEIGIVKWGTDQAAGASVSKTIESLVTGADPSKMVGNVFTGLILMGGIGSSLFLTFLMQVAQYLMLYFTAAFFPIAFMWLIDKNRRQFAMKIVMVWLATLIGHPLLIFLLTAVSLFVISTMNASWWGVDAIQSTVNLVAVFLACLMVAFVPLVLYKLAPIMPGMNSAGDTGSRKSSSVPSKTMDDVRNKMRDNNSRSNDRSVPASSPAGRTEGPAGTGPAQHGRRAATSPAAQASKSGAQQGAKAGAGAAGKAAGKAAAGTAAKTAGAAGATAATGGAAGAVIAAGKTAKTVKDVAKKAATTASDHATKPMDQQDEGH